MSIVDPIGGQLNPQDRPKYARKNVFQAALDFYSKAMPGDSFGDLHVPGTPNDAIDNKLLKDARRNGSILVIEKEFERIMGRKFSELLHSIDQLIATEALEKARIEAPFVEVPNPTLYKFPVCGHEALRDGKVGRRALLNTPIVQEGMDGIEACTQCGRFAALFDIRTAMLGKIEKKYDFYARRLEELKALPKKGKWSIAIDEWDAIEKARKQANKWNENDEKERKKNLKGNKNVDAL